jgi:WD40 repeat protein
MVVLAALGVLAVTGGASGQDEVAQTFAYIEDIVWSPDGRVIAYSYSDENSTSNDIKAAILIIDAMTQEVVKTLLSVEYPVHELDWKPDGTQLAGASYDTLGFRVWDVDLGDDIAIDQRGGQGCVSVRWHPTLEQLMVTSAGNGIGLFDANTWEYLRFMYVGGLHIDWNPDGTQFVTSSGYESEIYIADTETGERIASIETPTTRNGEIDWSADGTKIAAINYEEDLVRVWLAKYGRLLAEFDMPNVNDMRWSPDSQRLAAVSRDGYLRIWDIASGKVLATFSHSHGLYALDWSPDGTQIAFGGADTSGHPPQIMIVDAPQLPEITPTPTP